MIVVTGGAGFIGSNIVKALNEMGRTDILVVDNLENGHKFVNLVDCQIADYMDKATFLQVLQADALHNVELIFHEGACSTTTEWNGRYMMSNNFEYSKVLLHYCDRKKISFLYASSAAVYGASEQFEIKPEFEKPLNVYGYSKLLFDQYVRRFMAQNPNHAQIAGFRYFNVYGPREQHKGSMSSVAFHFNNQLKKGGVCRLFAGDDEYADGEQRRDFVFVEDVVKVNLWFMANKDKSGVFNLGTGASQTFNDVAKAVVAWHGQGELEYIPFPEHLKGAYQNFTEADLSELRQVGYLDAFNTVEQGVKKYLDSVNQ